MRFNRKAWKISVMFALSFVCLLFVGVLACFASNDSTLSNPIDVDVYVIALEGVDGHGVDNVSRVVEGVLEACRVDMLYYWTGGWSDLGFPVLGEVEIGVNVTVVDDWSVYRDIVESSHEVIVVNAHSEAVPVPSGYLKEDWVDEIAEAMACRNVTWVHTAGYPFYHYYHQESGEGEWGEEGFQMLMSHIGKNNVTCWPPVPETNKIRLHTDAEYSLYLSWHKLAFALVVECGKPLNASDFKDCLVAPIWGSHKSSMTGAIIKFSKPNQKNSFGFYVHAGTHQTYTSGGIETDGDFYRSYAGTAQAIYTFSFRFASEDAISDAEKAIIKAETEGRTKGIEEARQLLQQARDHYDSNEYVIGMRQARKAKDIAEKAIKPSLLETYAIPLAILGAGATTASGLALRHRRNSSKKMK